jgi:CO/xanthine dehydrogenase Mo-binding subunit
MGLGQALFEELRYDGTTLLNGEALDYRVPMADDLPSSFVSITQEQGHVSGPFGSKGIGEAGCCQFRRPSPRRSRMRWEHRSRTSR